MPLGILLNISHDIPMVFNRFYTNRSGVTVRVENGNLSFIKILSQSDYEIFRQRKNLLHQK